MSGRSLVVVVLCGGLALALLPAAGITQPADRVPTPPGMEALPRGPVHEAFAQPTDVNPQPGPVIPRQPPRAIEEQPPDQKPDGSAWVPGYWQWDEERSDFIWVSGFWRVPPPGRQWVPGSYRQTDKGFQWTPGVWISQNQQQLNVLPPPPRSIENGPAQPAPANNSIYVPGTWMYRQSGYAWRPGYWIDYRPDLVWCPAQYYWTPAGYVFVDGYWDYPLAGRGLLFAPMAFNGPVWNQPGFCYVPNFVVSVNFLPTALFVRPAWGHYYFGDYFGAGFARAGFTPWVNYRWGPRFYDPLYVHGYYANGAGWGRNLNTLYANRAAGQAILPPRTLGQQNTLIQNINVNRTNVNVTNVRVLSPLNQATDHGFRMTTLNQTQRLQYQRSGQQVRDLGIQRHNLEHQALSSHGTQLRAADAPRSLNLNVPHQSSPGFSRPAAPSAPAPAYHQGHNVQSPHGYTGPSSVPAYHTPGFAPATPQFPHGSMPHGMPHGSMPHASPAPHSSGGHHSSSGHGHR